MNQYETGQSGGFNIPSVAAGGETWILIKVNLNNLEKQKIRNGELRIFDICFKFFDIIEEQEKIIKQTISVKLMSESEYAEVEENKAVRSRLNEILISYEQETAYEAMNRNDWQAVDKSLHRIDALSMADPWLKASATVLKDHYKERDSKAFMKEAHYKARHLMSRMMPRGSSNIVNDSTSFEDHDDDRLASFLRRKKEEGNR